MTKNISKLNIHDFDRTSDVTLRDLAKTFGIKLNWIGFEENLPKPKQGAYIINIGDNNIGTHWVCLNIDKNKNALYFDSYAVSPSNDIILWADRNKIKNIYWNNAEQFQNLDEELCGLWCIVALYFMQKKGNIDGLVEMSNIIR